jgi:hypothetical protein
MGIITKADNAVKPFIMLNIEDNAKVGAEDCILLTRLFKKTITSRLHPKRAKIE